MKQIEIAFKLYQSKFPAVGDFISLYESIKNKHFAPSIIRSAYNKFMKDTKLKGKEREVFLNHLILSQKVS